MSDLEQTWHKLTQAARQAPARAATAAPYGLANRVVARWLAEKPENGLELWAFFARRVLLGAVLVMAGVVALNYADLADTWNVLSGSGPLLETVLNL